MVPAEANRCGEAFGGQQDTPSCNREGLEKGQTVLLGLRLRPTVPYNCCVRRKGGWMPNVSTKQVQRRIADLDEQYITQPKRPGRHALAVIILAIIAVAAFSSAHRTTSGFSRVTLKHDAAPKRQMSDPVQAEWNAVLGAASAGLKSGE